jgi:hypothetical protein
MRSRSILPYEDFANNTSLVMVTVLSYPYEDESRPFLPHEDFSEDAF